MRADPTLPRPRTRAPRTRAATTPNDSSHIPPRPQGRTPARVPHLLPPERTFPYCGRYLTPRGSAIARSPQCATAPMRIGEESVDPDATSRRRAGCRSPCPRCAHSHHRSRCRPLAAGAAAHHRDRDGDSADASHVDARRRQGRNDDEAGESTCWSSNCGRCHEVHRVADFSTRLERYSLRTERVASGASASLAETHRRAVPD